MCPSVVCPSVVCLFVMGLCGAGVARADGLADAQLGEVLACAPLSIDELSDDQVQCLGDAAAKLETAAADLALDPAHPESLLPPIRQLLQIRGEIDRRRQAILSLRQRLGKLPEGRPRRESVGCFLQTTSRMNQLSGHLRSLLHDVLGTVVVYLRPHPEPFRELLQVLLDHRADVGAVVMAYQLFEPPPESGLQPLTVEDRYAILNLIWSTRQWLLLSVLSDYLQRERHPGLVVVTAELIRRLGLPQEPRPGRDPTLPKPPIEAETLNARLLNLDPTDLAPHLVECHRELLDWLQTRIREGVAEDTYRLGDMELRAGDWLLMRNPSPYNRFTDLSPGLFTHVGVVTVEIGSDGIRRFVLVDLPERGDRIPATVIDAYLLRALHYVFLRHQDPTIGPIMGQAASAMIGNESLFDLRFDTSRVLAMKGQPLDDARIHTYCAGFLVLCAMQTSRPLDEFFPIHETVAAGNTAANLERIGLAIGEDFISPTGALFSPRMAIAAQSEPMYDPGREIQEAIYDRFADGMRHRRLNPSPNALQQLREELAALSQTSPWLTRALARASGVNEQLDLESAARTATVIEILDEIADTQVNAFAKANQAILAEGYGVPLEGGVPEEDRIRQQTLLAEHSDLVQRWTAGRLTPRQLRAELVDFYVTLGNQRVDQRFFAE